MCEVEEKPLGRREGGREEWKKGGRGGWTQTGTGRGGVRGRREGGWFWLGESEVNLIVVTEMAAYYHERSSSEAI